jgi:hypothetical protein
MYKVEKADFGYRLTFGGFMEAQEMRRWVDDSKKILETAQGAFGVFVDMRTLKPLPEDAQMAMQEGQKLFKEKGMTRSVVIVTGALTKIQFKRIAQETGIYQWERYIDATSGPDWEARGIGWISKAIDPDK